MPFEDRLTNPDPLQSTARRFEGGSRDRDEFISLNDSDSRILSTRLGYLDLRLHKYLRLLFPDT